MKPSLGGSEPWPSVVQREPLAEGRHALRDVGPYGVVRGRLEDADDAVGHVVHRVRVETPGRQRSRPRADPRRILRRTRISGDRVRVQDEPDVLERPFGRSAVETVGLTQVREDEVDVGPAGGEVEPALPKAVRERASVVDHLPGVGLELGLERLAEADGVSEGVAELSRLPTYPIDRPSREQVAVLAHLADRGPTSKKRLIEFGRTEELPFLADHDASNAKAEYRLLDSHVLESLLADGYVELESTGRRKRVRLTGRGADTLRAFEYLLDE